jgi:cell division protease FtsH
LSSKDIRNLLGAALIFAALLYLVFPFESTRGGSTDEISYSAFLSEAAQKHIDQVTIGENGVSGQLKSGGVFRVYVPKGDASYIGVLQNSGAKIIVDPPARSPLWLTLLVLLLPFLVLAGLWMVMAQRQGRQSGSNQAMSFGKSQARLHIGGQPRVTFNDVAGVEEAKDEFEEIVEFLRHPRTFQALGAKIPRGVLLAGPPGSGKTLLAKAIAGEVGVPFFSISGSEFVEMFVGVGASRVRDLFDQAKKHAPCLVFIDEIDAVGRHRSSRPGGGNDEREQTLNQLLVEMDGFGTNSGIIVIAATNRPDILDAALLRPGRFDRRIVMGAPDTKGRRAILEVHTREKPIAADADLEVLARSTPGFSGADLANVVNEAALLTARRGKPQIGMSEFDEAIERVIAGPQRKSRLLSPKERELTAYHEGGHALVGKLLPEANPPHKVTILPRGMALGYTIQLPQTEQYTLTRGEILANITAILGGRVAEEVVFGEITTGAANDFEQATTLARKMVTEFGMSDSLGPLAFGTKHGPAVMGGDLAESRNYSDEIAYEIDKEVRRIIDECYGRARTVLTVHRHVLDRIARALLERESLASDDLDALIVDQPLPSVAPLRTALPTTDQSTPPLGASA